MSAFWIRRLLAEYRAEGCPPADRAKTDEDYDPPCRLCTYTDAVLAERGPSLDWQSDAEIVAETQEGLVVTCRPGQTGWQWIVEEPHGWAMRQRASGHATGLVDALAEAERAVQAREPS